jgi:N-acetylglucosamine-6-phosphate deacetylase
MTHKGFIDLQVNGYLGVDFTSASLQLDDICRATEALVKAGTIGYCATLITAPLDIYQRNLSLIARAMEEPGVRGRLLGIHLEGPYLSAKEGARGAHQACWMRRPDPGEFDRIQDWARGSIRILTLAPELESAISLISHVTKKYSTRIALGHHLASREAILKSIEAGASLVTHLGNGCPNLLHRHENIIVHQLATDGLMTGIITDGNHIPEDFIRIVIKCKGPQRLYVVSDSAPIAGLKPGLYTNMGIKVRLSDSGRIEQLTAPYLAGSGCTIAECMRHLRSLAVLSEDELWQVGFENPLRIIGISPASLAPNQLPDFRW